MIIKRKSQQGVFIGVFALATLVVISLAISFMSNRVNELLVSQGQMISGKQAYWSAYSGMELLSGSQLADASNAGTKTYSFSGGTISTVGESSAALYNGVARTNVHTVTGSDGNSNRQLKRTLDSPTLQAYDFAPAAPKLTMSSAVSNIASEDNFTISAWVYMDAIDERPLFGLNAEEDDHWIQFTDANVMGFKGTGDEESLTHGLTFSTGSWQHIVITRTSPNTVTVYLNGIAGGTTLTWDEAFAPDAIGTSNNGTRQYFDGRIAQVAIWDDVALPEAQVRSIYIQGLSFDIRTDADDALTNLETGLVHYWTLNGGVSDSEGSNHLTASSDCTATGI